MDAIITYDLTKQFNNVTALSKINLQIGEGESFACVGDEKSGKTTLIRLLSGLARPSAGESIIMGHSPVFEPTRVHSLVGTVLDSAKMYANLTLSENLRFFANVNGVDENDSIDRVSFLLHRLDIWESRDIKVSELPTSVRRRGALARAMMHKPKLLLIDETAESIDRETAESVRSLLTYLREQERVAVFVATQNMYYAERLCENFALLNKGEIIAKGSLDALRKGSGVGYTAKLRLADGDVPPKGCTFSEGYWIKEISSEEMLPKLISQAVEKGKTVFEARLEVPSLKEIYNAYTSGEQRKAGDYDEQNDESSDEWEDPITEQPNGAEFGTEQDETESDFGPLDPEILKLLQGTQNSDEIDGE